MTGVQEPSSGSPSINHVAVVNRSSKAADGEVAWWVEGARVFLDHVFELWGELVFFRNVFFYADGTLPPAADPLGVVWILDDAGDPEASAYHTAIGRTPVGAVSLAQSESPSRSLAHELGEMAVNLWLDRWFPVVGSDRQRAGEICDPVQEVSAEVDITIGNKTRAIEVPDFVGPAWFGLPDDWSATSPLRGRIDWLDAVHSPGQIMPGGYQMERDGAQPFIRSSPMGAAWSPWKSNPLSRTSQLLGGVQLERRKAPP